MVVCVVRVLQRIRGERAGGQRKRASKRCLLEQSRTRNKKEKSNINKIFLHYKKVQLCLDTFLRLVSFYF